MHNHAKRTLGIALTGALAVSCIVAASAETTTPDYKGHWSESYMQDFVDAKLMEGNENGEYMPKKQITRAEFMTFVNKFYGFTEEASDEEVQKYTDMQDTGKWYYSQVAKALAAGYISGTGNNEMSPTKTITRNEIMTILGKITYGSDYTLSAEEIKANLEGFKDADQVASWAEVYTAALIRDGIVSGTDAKTLIPTSVATRAEAVTMLCKIPQYVEMNIPYAEFYAAELNNDVKVDAMTSATKTKTRSGGMMSGGSYHVNEDGSDITGITYPVKIKRIDLLKSDYQEISDDRTITITTTNRGQTSTKDYVGVDSLFEAPSYAYYVLSETPETYKVATVEDGVISFSALTGDTEATKLTATAVLTTETGYGDYQVDLDLGKDADGNAVDAEKTFGTISGVILSTKEGHDYGLRHLENIWRRTELSWGVGYTTQVHNCPVSSDHYKAIQGETITKITYITSNGIFTIDTELYVPVKDGVVNGLAVANAKVDAKTTDVTANLPSDYQATYTAPAGCTVADGKLTWDSILPGTYTLKVEDASGKYAPVSTTFTLSTDTAPAQAAEDTFSVVKTEAASNEEFANYLKNITAVTVNGTKYAATGRGSVKVIKTDGSIDFTTKPFQSAGVDGKYVLVISSTGYPDVTVTVAEETYIYAYASLTYGEYWADEAVYANDNTTSSTVADRVKEDKKTGTVTYEYDKGGFDAVTRATSNHGLHRGSFHQDVTIHTSSGTDYTPVIWTDGNNFVATDGKTYDKTKIGITSYEITGLKYVPVAVKVKDFAKFASEHEVTLNGQTIQGGYAEVQLTTYSYTAAVDANTNGLKVATLTDGKWSFSARKTGTGTGYTETAALISAAETIKNTTVTVKEYDGSYGEFLRVDITGDGYGALGSAMESVVWTYYGNDDTYTNAVRTYGTKFAADNWMHKSMGIQLGLTDSARCQLPEGYDGTGYWTVTIYALGYEDVTYQVQVTADNLPKAVELMTEEQKTQLTTLKDQAAALLTNYNAETATKAEKDLNDHYNEAVTLLADAKATKAGADELLNELPTLIAAVEAERTPTSQTLTGTATIADNTEDEWTGYDVYATVIVEGSTVKSVTVTANNPQESDKYLGWAVNGRENKGLTGVPAQYADKSVEDAKAGTGIDAVTGATFTSDAIKEAVTSALNSAK